MSTVCSHVSGEPGCTAQVCPAQVSAEPLIRGWMLGQDCNRIVDLVQKGLLIQVIQNLLFCCAISHCVTDLFCKTRSHFVIRGPLVTPPRTSGNLRMHFSQWWTTTGLLLPGVRMTGGKATLHSQQCAAQCALSGPPSGLPALKEPWQC